MRTYLFERTDAQGGVLETHGMSADELRRFLLLVCGFARREITHGMDIAENNPGVAFELGKFDENGAPRYLCRFTALPEHTTVQ